MANETGSGDLLEILRSVPAELPVMPLRNVVAFPLVILPLTVGRPRSLQLLDEIAKTHKFLGLTAQKKAETDSPGPDDIHRLGCVARVLKIMRSQEDNTQTILVQGLARLKIRQILRTEPFMLVSHEVIMPVEPPKDDKEIEARMLLLKQSATRMIQLSSSMPEEAAQVIQNIEHPGALADVIVANLNLPVEEKQRVLETFDLKERLDRAAKLVNRELDVLELSSKIQQQVKGSIDKSQRDYYLREQMKAIQEELGEGSPQKREAAQLRERIEKANPPEEAMKEANRELERLATMNPAAAEYSTTRTYLEWVAELPWNVLTRDRLDIERARKILDEDHYDLEKVKKRILEYLAVRKLNPAGRGPILCFVGPPGVGKTSLGRSVARALGRKFVRMSLGGLHDEAEIRGHRRTYVGAMPGRIIQNIRRVGSRNPVFMLDEIDKVGQDFRGDPSSALLEVLDPEQNSSFADNYLNVDFDLSAVMFITTANILDTIPAPLLDRMEVLHLSGYTEREKLFIAKKYLVGRQIKENGLKRSQVRFSDSALRGIIRQYTREAGVRNLERAIGSVCRGIARGVAAGKIKSASVKASNLAEYLGQPKYWSEIAEQSATPGIATGLAWTPTGGTIIFIEATAMPGKGNLILTGQLGNVMKESAQAALSYLRAHADDYGVKAEFFSDNDIHLHVPAGSIPKDGPSAGITIFAALVSLATGKPVPSKVAMTGEITLRGRVLPVGGIKEKLIAAHRAGIREILIPDKCESDLEDVPDEIRKQIDIHLVRDMKEVTELAIKGVGRKKTSRPGKRTGRKPRSRAGSPSRRPKAASKERKNKRS